MLLSNGTSSIGLKQSTFPIANTNAKINSAYNLLVSNSKFIVDEILGRSIIIHEDKDDLGLGTFEDSKTTGHAGNRIVCGIIGLRKNPDN